MKKIIRNNFLMIKYIYRFCPSNLFLIFFQSICVSFISVFNVIYIKIIIDTISSNNNFDYILKLLLLYICIQIVYYSLNNWLQYFIIPKNNKIIYKKMQLEIFNKAKKVDLSCYENKEFYDKYYMATQQSDTRAIAVINSFSTMLSTLFSGIALLTLVVSLQKIIIVIVMFNVLITFFINSKIILVQHNHFNDRSPIERETEYTKIIFNRKEYAKEIRLFDKFPILLINIFENSSSKLIELISSYGKKNFYISIVQVLVGILSNAGIIIYLSYKVVMSIITIGDFVALLNASQQLSQQISSFLNVASEFYEHSVYIENFKYFMEYKPKIKENKDGKKISSKPYIELKNIDFSYINTNKKILKNISMLIPYGKKIAFVGPNGAGKSTLVKLLLRLYEPDNGKILIDKIDYRNYSLKSIRNTISIVLQDYQIYSFSIAENILMRPIENKEKDEVLVNSALKFVGLYNKVKELPEGIYTKLSQEFSLSGVQFSGGECQKIVIARAYIKRSNIIILDEPSSALDPIAEQKILDSTFKLLKNKTVIMISHKMSNIKKFDYIYLIDKGEVVECGNHNELIKLNGQYAKMYNNQFNKYK